MVGRLANGRRRRQDLTSAWALSRRPRHHIRRRLRRAARCVGAFAATLRHLHSTRAHSAPSVGRCTGTSWPDLGRVRAQLLRSARASRRAAKGARARRAQVDGKWRDGWEQVRPPTRLEPAAAGRRPARARGGKQGRTAGRIKGGPSQYPEKAAALAFFQLGPQEFQNARAAPGAQRRGARTDHIRNGRTAPPHPQAFYFK